MIAFQAFFAEGLVMQDLLTEKSIFSGVLGLKIQRILASEVYLYAVFSRTIATFLQWAGLYWLLFKASVTPYAWMVVRVADLMANRKIVDWALLILRDSSMSCPCPMNANSYPLAGSIYLRLILFLYVLLPPLSHGNGIKVARNPTWENFTWPFFKISTHEVY